MESVKDLLERNGISRQTSTDEPFDLMAYTRRRVEAANRVPGNLTGYDCPVCLNRGYIHCMKDNGEEYVRDCECMVQRKAQAVLKKSGLSDTIQRYTFDTWQAPELWQQKAKLLAEKYVSEQSGWFLAAGHSGSGKTHLCTAICAELLKSNIAVRYVLWRDVAVQAKAAVTDDDEYCRIVSPLKSVPVLYIDDLFKTGNERNRDGVVVPKAPTTGDVNLAFEILNNRYNDSTKLTIISTERGIDDLLDIDEAIGSRIYERSKGYRLDFSNKPNWRLKDG